MTLHARSLPAALVNTAALPLVWLLERWDAALCRANAPWDVEDGDEL